jgi:RNA polymerase sigma-32 factor
MQPVGGPTGRGRALNAKKKKKKKKRKGESSTEELDLLVPELLEAEPLVPDQLEYAGEQGLIRYDPVRRYLAEISRFKPLSREEEYQLALRYHEEGDREAARILISANLKMVVRLAFMFSRFYQNVMDLVQEGNIGLMQAVNRFDPFRGTRLSTYATFWVRAYMIKFLTDNWRLVRVGTTNVRRKLLFNLQKEKARLESMGIGYGPKLLAEKFNATVQDIRDIEESLGSSDLSLDQPLGFETDRSFGDILADDDEPLEDVLANEDFLRVFRDKVALFAEDLDERDRDILEKRLIAEEPLTLQEIGDRYGITREGSRQAEKKLLQRLKIFIKQEMSGGAAAAKDPD